MSGHRSAVTVNRKQKGVIQAQKSKALWYKEHLRPGTKLLWQVKTNPRKKGSNAYKMFQKCIRAKTAEEWMQLGGDVRTLQRDHERGLVKFSAPRVSKSTMKAPKAASSERRCFARVSWFTQQMKKPETKLVWQRNNPKKVGSDGHKKFQKYRGAKTVGEYLQIVRRAKLWADNNHGKAAETLKRDYMRGFVKLLDGPLKRPASHQQTESPQQTEIKIACLGDSNTIISGPRSYPTRLQIFLGRLDAKCSVRGFGVSGAHAVPGRMHYGSTEKCASALAWKGNIYVIMLGTNDTHQARGEPEKVEESLNALVSKVRTACPGCQPILVLPPGNNSARCRERMTSLVHPGLRRLGKKLGITVVDPKIISYRHLREDQIHLNEAGALKVANAISTAIKIMIKLDE